MATTLYRKGIRAWNFQDLNKFIFLVEKQSLPYIPENLCDIFWKRGTKI